MRKCFFLLLSFTLCGLSLCEAHEHYVASRGFFTPKYDKDFKHFSYAHPLAHKGGAIALAARGSFFDSFNAHILKGTAPEGVELLHATLMTPALDDPNVVYPYVAESIYVSSDHRYVIFKLNKQAVFNDGSALTSKDVVFSFQLLQKHGAPQYAMPYKGVLSVIRIDPHTVKFEFKEPSRLLPFILAKMPIFSKEFYRSYDFNESSLVPPLGSGPYEIDSFRPGEFITYKRVRNWWGRSLPVNVGQYNFDKVTYRYFKNKDVIVEALARNLVDYHWEWSISRWLHQYDFPAIQSGKVVKKDFKKPYPHGLNAFFINTRRPHLRDRRVRKALNLLFNFEWFNHKICYDHYERNQSIHMDTGYGAKGTPSEEELALLQTYDKSLYPPEAALLPFKAPENSPGGLLRIHFEEALTLLQSAGWRMEKGVLNHPVMGRFRLKMLFPHPSYEKQYQEYFTTLQRFGIEVEPQSVDTSAYMARVHNFDYDVVLHFNPPFHVPGKEQENMWTTKAADTFGSFNLAGVKNFMVDDLVEKIVETESLSQLELYASLLDRVISWGYYMIPMWAPSLVHVAYWDKFQFVPTAENENVLYPHAWWSKPGCDR